MTPELIGLLKDLTALASLLVTSYVAWIVRPLPKAIDGAQDEAKELREEVGRLRGVIAGVAQEKADQALRDTPSQSQQLPASPAPVPVSIIPDEDAPVPVVVRTQTESAEHQEDGTPERRNVFMPPMEGRG